MQTHRASRVIAASPEEIFQAFQSAEAIASWRPPAGMTCRIHVFEPRQDGNFRMEFGYGEPDHDVPGKTSAHADVFHGRFLEWVVNERIVESVEFETRDPAFAGVMTITTALKAVPEGTLVTILCENVPLGIGAADHDAGMTSSLENLAAFTERKTMSPQADN